MKPDVQTDADIRAIVDAFYGGIERDPVLGPYFEGIDLAAHLPKMYAFWSSIVFQRGTYRGRPFDPHARMPGLDAPHFERWVGRFRETVAARFEGPNAASMVEKAGQIASIFQWKLGVLTFVDEDPHAHGR